MELPGGPLLLEVDPVRFQQIIVNILNNAAKYTPPGGRIKLVCKRSDDKVMIEIRDSGIGIPHEFLDEIFEPFRQIRPTPQVGTGLGIGLWLTKRLVEMHGGTISATSEGPERGSVFTMYFPVPTLLLTPPQAEKKKSPAEPGARKIMIVDDNEAAADGLKKLLEFKGHAVVVAHTGTAALAEVDTFAPHVILLDIGLPDIDGYEVARRLRRKETPATLIALTGYGQEEDKTKALEAGFDFHLTKPVGIAEIEAILADIS